MALAGFDVYDEPLKLRIHVSLLLKLAPLLAQQSRTAGALKIALEEVLGDELGGAEIIVREFAGSWTEIETDSQTRLGERNSELGRTALLGRPPGEFSLVACRTAGHLVPSLLRCELFALVC